MKVTSNVGATLDTRNDKQVEIDLPKKNMHDACLTFVGTNHIQSLPNLQLVSDGSLCLVVILCPNLPPFTLPF